MIKQGQDFSKGSIGRHVLTQAVPLIIAQLIQLLYNLVDRIYIGHLPGENGMALTGIGLVFPIVTLVTAFTNLFGMGGGPLCSIARGAGKTERAEKIMGNCMTLLFATSFFIMALCYVLKKPVLYLFGASDVTYPYADTYLKIYLLGTVFSMVGTGMNNFITVQGFPAVAMYTTVIGAVINLILDPVLIFLFHMGIEGAAIATIFAQGVSALWVMRFLTGKKAVLKLRKKYFVPDWKLVKEILSLGLSGFIMSATNCVSQVACNSMLKIYGGDLYIGIMTILNSVREVISMPVSGITSGAQPILGYNFGARKYGRVKEGIRFMTGAGSLYTAAAWLILLIFPKPFLMLFTSNQEMIQEGVSGHPDLLCRFCFYAVSVFRAVRFCRTGKIPTGGIFLPVPESNHCASADDPPAGRSQSRNYRGLSGGTHIQRDRRAGLFYHHVFCGLPETRISGGRGGVTIPQDFLNPFYNLRNISLIFFQNHMRVFFIERRPARVKILQGLPGT